MIWRPRNETATDLAREERAREHICGVWNCEGTKLSESLYEIDWMFSRGHKVVALGEFKARAKRYATLQIGAAKFYKGMELAGWIGVPFFLFIQWADQPLQYVQCDMNKINPCIVYNSRGQNGDREPGVEIAVEHFREVHRGLSPQQCGSRGQHSRSPLKSESGRQG